MNPVLDNDLKPVSGTYADSSPLIGKPDLLRDRANEDGLLFFKGLLPRTRVLDVRRGVLDILDSFGVMDRNYPLMEGMADIEAVNRYTSEELQWNGVGVTLEMYHRIQKLEAFHALAHSPEILSVFAGLFNEAPFPHPRNIGRIMLPHRETKITPSHQDFLHIQGATDTWTCWMPLGDVSRELGGLAVLKGSHKAGLLGVSSNPGAGGLESILCGLDYDWQTADYEAGDVLVFHSHTVHKSMPNRVPGQIRLSCDYRYQPASAVIEPASLKPHGPFEWDELYEGWADERLKHYWADNQFQLTEFDHSIRWQKEKIC
ncbi:phytanoyl-CoA dioxygenase family protein [Cohnella rhizosphaerae]|uniref:Phytanoyl-CoA dioxygenase family protein n=1 Tax=Cohnella rhizosphaerae TaxID=1457232 RepID=A0A9X4QVN5_9BACL|nr:phytanoyl-CoA dioxygenase family protein [Cohnella rhizosphaerae]MDG0812759.1 phytanoyl-CoA dioxygenase family protein [Cohnella rhizosphaerae]